MKILHVLSSQIFSGAENVVCQIIGMFADRPDVEMAYCSPAGTNVPSLQERGINFLPIDKLSVKELKRVINDYEPDIIQAHDMRASFVAARACGNIHLISHIHNNNFNSRGLSPKSIAYFFAAKKAKHIIWVSQSSFNGYAFSGKFKDKSTVLYNVIDTDALMERMAKDDNSYDYDAIFVGRMTYQKNLHKLLQIARLAADKKLDIKIAIAGKGEDEAELKELATSLDLNDNVTFLGFQSNPAKMLHDSKCMVLTSRWEGTPMVALEAIALGTPIVSTPVDGMLDLVTDKVNGYLIEDDLAFADKLVLIANDADLHEKLVAGQLARSKEVNNIENYKAKLCQIYGIE